MWDTMGEPTACPGLYSPLRPSTLLEQVHRNTISPLSPARPPNKREATWGLRLGFAPGLLYTVLQRGQHANPY